MFYLSCLRICICICICICIYICICICICTFLVFQAHCRKQNVHRVPEDQPWPNIFKPRAKIQRIRVYWFNIRSLTLFWFNIIEGWNPQRPQPRKKGDLSQVSPACVDGWHPWCADLCWTGSRQDGSQGTKPLGNHRRPFLLVQILSRPAVKAVVNSLLWG